MSELMSKLTFNLKNNILSKGVNVWILLENYKRVLKSKKAYIEEDNKEVFKYIEKHLKDTFSYNLFPIILIRDKENENEELNDYLVIKSLIDVIEFSLEKKIEIMNYINYINVFQKEDLVEEYFNTKIVIFDLNQLVYKTYKDKINIMNQVITESFKRKNNYQLTFIKIPEELLSELIEDNNIKSFFEINSLFPIKHKT